MKKNTHVAYIGVLSESQNTNLCLIEDLSVDVSDGREYVVVIWCSENIVIFQLYNGNKTGVNLE